MKRDTLFKAKDKVSNQWVEGDHIFYSMQDFIIKRGTLERVKVESNTLCQSVGMSAYWENKENELMEAPLWEHDLLEIKNDGYVMYKDTILVEVMFDCGSFILVSDDFVDGYIPLFDVVEYGEVPYINGKVVGNAFDNPEILDKNNEVER